LVADRGGYRNLCRVISRIQLAEAKQVPEASSAVGLIELLAGHADGVRLLVGDPELAGALYPALRGRLGLGGGRPGRRRHEERLLECGRRLGLRLVASTAAHFVAADDYPAFRLITAVRQNTLLDRLPGTLNVTPEHRLTPADELRQRFHDLPEAIDNGEALAGGLPGGRLPQEPGVPHA